MAKFQRSNSRRGRRSKAASLSFGESERPKLKLGTPGDQFEREADSVADKVVSQDKGNISPMTQATLPVQPQFLHRQSEKEEQAAAKFIQKQGQEEEDKMQRQEEEEEAVQSKFLQAQEEKEEPVQSQEEEEEIQPRFAQLQAEEEEPQAKLVQLQSEEEEEPQAKYVQMQEEKEEPQAKMIQRFAESDTVKVDRKSAISKKDGDLNTSDQEQKKPSFNFEESLEVAKAAGRPLDDGARNYMEEKMGHNFGSVRIHTDPEAVQLAKHIKAQAFTVGNHIFFNVGKYNPDTDEGLKLLAHELTHVIQQGF